MGNQVSRWHSLKTRATVFTLAIFVLGIWALSLFVSRTLQADMERVLGVQQFSVVNVVAKNIDSEFTQRLQSLEAVAKEMDADLVGRPAALQARLEQRPLLQLLFNGGVFVTGVDGTATADVPLSAGRIGTNYMDREAVSVPLKEGKSVFGRPAMGKKLQAPIFSIGVPIRDAKGQVIGALVGTVNLGKPSFLDALLTSPYGKTGGYALVALRDRLIVTATDKSRTMVVLPAKGVSTWVDQFIDGFEGSAVGTNMRGVDVLASGKNIPVNGWYLLASLPAAEAFAPLQAQRERLYGATVLLTLLIYGLTWWVLRRELAPLVATAQAMEALAGSEQMPQPLSGTYAGEIGQLVAAFNRILETSVQREKSLVASESFKDAILNSLDAEIAVVDREGVIQAVNARWQQFALDNCPESGAREMHTGVGSSYLGVCGDSVSAIRMGLQSVLQGSLPSFSCEYPCNAPLEERWFFMIAMPFGNSGAGGAVITHTDITARKHSELALQHRKLMLERTESVAHLASFEWEVDTNIVTWSPEMFRIFGRDPALGTPNLEGQAELYTPASTQTLFDAVSKSLADGTPYTIELMTLQPDGAQRPCIATGFPERDTSGRVVRITGLLQDITDRKREEEKTRLAASVFAHSREGIMITAKDGTILEVNEAFVRITGYGREEAVGRNPRFLTSGRQDAHFYAAMWQSLSEHGHWNGEVWNRRKNGEVYAELLTISAVKSPQGETQQYVALFSDITALKAHQSQLEQIAHFDALTQLPNRLLLADRLQQAMAQVQRRGLQLAVVFLDLDGFKTINDSFGHDVGDQFLIALATAMKDALREGDTLARIGGDEFVAVLIDLESTDSSLPMLARLLAAASKPVQLGERVLQGSASLGVTFYPQAEGIEADQLLRQADQAMYQAKLAGKDQYQVFSPAQDAVTHAHS